VCHSILLVLFFALALPHTGQAASPKRHAPATGALRVWVPAAMVGDDYWIYLNGHVVSSPPHSATDPRTGAGLVTVATGKLDSHASREKNDGWAMWGTKGVVLRMHHENWDNTINNYLNSGSNESLHIFQAVELPLRGGTYTVEVAFLTSGATGGSAYGSSFPFVISQKRELHVVKGETTRFYQAVPDDWSNTPALAMAVQLDRVCPRGPAPPDLDQLQRQIKEYLDDPMVKALRAVNTSTLSRSKGVVVLDLPPGKGGSREFNGGQIRHIVDAISATNDFPNQSDVTNCLNRYPQYSRSYAQYGKVIADIDHDLESFRKLAAKLEGSQ
jgi:hypothetical protein